ncbi:hypothetical protein [Saccharopolyspora shandongensis]|uniref:hypothetical protein n=1 Tax=Saccharopolyspora shandongensis TaxID=418495 RepID=UPI000AEDC04C|nr:hypothetical protein [Saccharopolyspora shandongensis]
MLLRLAYLGLTNAFAMLRLLPMSDRDKDIEILALRHQITVLKHQLGHERVRFTPADRAFIAALLHPLPRNVALIENSSAQVKAGIPGVADVVRDCSCWDPRLTGDRRGMMVDRAAETGVPRHGEHIRHAAPATDE